MTGRTSRWPLLVAVMALTACGGAEKNDVKDGEGRGTSTSARTVTPASDDRDTWQMPDVVLEVMGDLNGKVVADLFPGDGYFTFRLIEQGARVIAIVNDQAAADALLLAAGERGIPDGRLEVRIAPENDPGLGMEEADLGLAVTSYLTILDRPSYFSKLRVGLKDPNRFFLVDFKQMETPVGPPMEYRAPVEGIMDELGNFGFSDVAAHSGKLPYQFIMLVQDFTALPEDGETMNIP